MQATISVTEVYSTPFGQVSQCDIRKCLIVEFEGKTTELSVPCFFCLKRTLDRIDLEHMAKNTDPAADIEIVAPHGCAHCFALRLSQIVHLKELLAGAKVMLELNSILHERIYKPVL